MALVARIYVTPREDVLHPQGGVLSYGLGCGEIADVAVATVARTYGSGPKIVLGPGSSRGDG
jgi:hypothetical protein